MADKNYTPIENDLFKILSQLELNGSEFRVLLFLLRQSMCYRRDYTKECAALYIANGINMSDRQVKRALKMLVDKKLIFLDTKHSSKKGQSWYINSDKFGCIKGHVWSIKSDIDVPSNLPNMSHKESTVSNYSINYSKKEIDSRPNLSLEELARLSQEEEE